ncbi:MAG TPA: lytic transglycosylase domain-containing protein, partial [Thermoanaerobaculia bacterium]|nr:lytic transglycosylase domain-containing protein [Thermoanaerobaculia bacterium]
MSDAPARPPDSAPPERLSPHSPSRKSHRDGARRLSRILGPFALWTSLSFSAGSARATLVVFEDGRLLHVEKCEVVPGHAADGEDDRVSMTFSGGGTMTVSLEVVDRIVDDEYERPPAVEPGDCGRSAVEAPSGASRSLRAFSESSLPSLSSPYSSQILAAAKEHRVDPAFIAAVIRAESNGVPTAVSRKGARGLMQLMPATSRRLGVRRPFDPKENIRGGTAYIAELAARYGDTRPDLVLAAYNAGERAV